MGARYLGTLPLVLVATACVWLTAPAHAQQAEDEGMDARAHTGSPGAFVHSVFFWLRPELSREERAAFVQGLESLRDIEMVQYGWIGVPASTDRPIIDRSYSYALTLVFADDAGQHAYQVHPVHDRFREEFGDFWTDVQIYDSVPPAELP